MKVILDIFYSFPPEDSLSTLDPLLRILPVLPKASLIYKFFHSADPESAKTKMELTWETDLGCEWSKDFWNKIWARSLKTSRSASTTQSMFFLYHRLFFTPISIANFAHTNNKTCWSCDYPLADLLHLLFSCPR